MQTYSVPCFLAVGCADLEQETCYTAHERHHIYSKSLHERGKGVLLWFRCSALTQDVYAWAAGSHSNHTGNKHPHIHTFSHWQCHCNILILSHTCTCQQNSVDWAKQFCFIGNLHVLLKINRGRNEESHVMCFWLNI